MGPQWRCPNGAQFVLEGMPCLLFLESGEQGARLLRRLRGTAPGTQSRPPSHARLGEGGHGGVPSVRVRSPPGGSSAHEHHSCPQASRPGHREPRVFGDDDRGMSVPAHTNGRSRPMEAGVHDAVPTRPLHSPHCVVKRTLRIVPTLRIPARQGALAQQQPNRLIPFGVPRLPRLCPDARRLRGREAWFCPAASSNEALTAR